MANKEFMGFLSEKHYLSDILVAQSKSDLQLLAEILNIKGYKKLKIDDLKMAIYKTLRDPQIMADYLKYFPYETRKVFSKEESYIPFQLGPNPYEEIVEHLYLSPITDEDNWYLVIPEEIKDTYKKAVSMGLLPSKDDIYSLLRICLAGATHIYGMCTMEHFCNLVKELTGLDVDSDYVIDFCESLKAYPNLANFVATDEYVCDINLFEEGYDEFLKVQNNTKDYYMPTLEELTFISEYNHIPFNIHANAVKNFLTERGYIDEEFKAIVAVALLQNLITTGFDPDEAIGEILTEYINEDLFNRLILSEAFFKRYEVFVNSTRIAFFKGHTPEEVFGGEKSGNVVQFPSGEKN